jgi:lipoate-protein ligase A
VEKLNCRLLPFEIADGPTNMATDEVLLRSAAAGIATLRFYGWSPPTLSLGYFQSEKFRHADPLLAPLPVVRRLSGGAALVHHHEVTYALALPAGAWQQGKPWTSRMHSIIVAAFRELGLQGSLHALAPYGAGSTLCYLHCTPDDVMVANAKVVGSAQRKHRGAILQHGGILLAQSPHTPNLPGIRELTGLEVSAESMVKAVRTGFERAIKTALADSSLSPGELEAISELKTDRYSNAAWTSRR